MSQQKVDKYKEEKANRQKSMRKQKRSRVLRMTLAVLIVGALVGWFSISLVQSHLAKREPVPTVINDTAINGFMTELDELITEQ